MLLTYFDEIKPNPPDQMYFLIGGLSLPASDALVIERQLDELALSFFGTSVLSKENEFHGRDIFHGKSGFKGRSLGDRLQLFKALIDILDQTCIARHVVKINVSRHRQKYRYPMPEYNLGLMLLVEMIDDHLESRREIGMLFGDYERDQADNSIISLSEFRQQGTLFVNRPIRNLIDTLYFAKSHHSRFVQLADVYLYLVQIEHYHRNGGNRLREELLAYLDSKPHLLGQAVVKTWP